MAQISDLPENLSDVTVINDIKTLLSLSQVDWEIS
jgi:hypothetical protein